MLVHQPKPPAVQIEQALAHLLPHGSGKTPGIPPNLLHGEKLLQRDLSPHLGSFPRPLPSRPPPLQRARRAPPPPLPPRQVLHPPDLPRLRRDRPARPVGDHDHLQRSGRHAAAGQPGVCRHRRAAQAAPRPHPQPGRDGEGLCRPRARHARGGGAGAQRGDHRGRRRLPAGRRRERAVSGALRQLFALVEAYPDLKANPNFQQLQGELSDIENKLAAARRFFNNAVQEYNTGIQQFPAVLFAGSLGFAPQEFFDLGETERKVLEPGAAGEVLRGSACPGRARQRPKSPASSDRRMRVSCIPVAAREALSLHSPGNDR